MNEPALDMKYVISHVFSFGHFCAFTCRLKEYIEHDTSETSVFYPNSSLKRNCSWFQLLGCRLGSTRDYARRLSTWLIYSSDFCKRDEITL